MTGDGQAQFLQIAGDGPGGGAARRIAYMHRPAAAPGGPGLLWLSGFKSDMASTKATAVSDYAARRGWGGTLFDYSGHGRSEGRFEDGTIGQWLDEAVAVFRQVTRGPQVVIGSSMGGHIALVLARRLGAADPEAARRLKALVLIAPAWDMTEELMWRNMPAEARRELETAGVTLRPSEYGAPYAITRRLIEDGRSNLIGRAPFDPGMPVYILQGLLDPDVPAAHTRALVALLPPSRVTLVEVPDGEHRLSRPEDLAKLYALIERAASAAV